MDFRETIETTGHLADLAGVAIIVLGGLLATALAIARLVRSGADEGLYRSYRRALGRAILLGLEVLVAADIIRTIAIEPTLESAAVLGLIVLVRTFLSFSLEVELEGRWPWQRRQAPPSGAEA